jgi:hypothetical protein
LKVYVCKAQTDGLLCQDCSLRTPNHIRHQRRIHGLLTEPIPHDSHIYGSPWYIQQVERYGEPPDEWVESAKAQQEVAEQWVEDAWKIREPLTKALPEALTKALPEALPEALPSAVPSAVPTTQVKPEESTVSMKKPKGRPKNPPSFEPHVFQEKPSILFMESDKPIMKVSTDSWHIEKGVYKGIPVWILPNGKRFDMDEHGELRNLLPD